MKEKERSLRFALYYSVYLLTSAYAINDGKGKWTKARIAEAINDVYALIFDCLDRNRF